MARYVRLPDGAQVTMSREEYESTQGRPWKLWAVIAVLAFFALPMLTGHGKHSTDTPKPGVTHSTPAPFHSCTNGHCP